EPDVIKPAAAHVKPAPSKIVVNDVPDEDGPVAAKPVKAAPVKQPETKTDAGSDEDFAKLKADLDKVVYADDSKLPAEKPVLPVAAVKEPVKKMAVPVKKPSAAAYYTIKKGETAFSIAKKNNVTVGQLFEWNNIDA